ncbi:hypothetical protein UFOVP181_301 [uncultured Caudovirales phage]|uniref:Uncharacterized protein n=1 Tax=uncultured Caudovirales phage TaxID=2100421 RepID=A0A6J7WL90_9CAUD|nr:hypothetical protein UFOVP57_338 [uncultured Caudovirales phage]CAB5209060.1 hypothetical protein UFOVP181_301 [uncultured Caudovirales phage]
MHTIIDNNEYIDLYNFSSLITEDDNKQITSISKSIIDSGQYFVNSPKFQTKENLFARQEPVWLKMRQSFIYSCFMFLGKEVRIKNMMSWVFMTSAKDTEDRINLWHNHHIGDNDGTTDTLSGIWYAHIPKNVTNPELTGTEFALNYPDFDNTVFVRPKDLTWVVYPSKLWHRPGITDSDEYRFVFAADMEYYK